MATSIYIGNENSEKREEGKITIVILFYYSRFLNQLIKFLLIRCKEVLVAIQTYKSKKSSLNRTKFN